MKNFCLITIAVNLVAFLLYAGPNDYKRTDSYRDSLSSSAGEAPEIRGPFCCTCETTEGRLVEFTKGSHLCQKDFNTWLQFELKRIKSEGDSEFCDFDNIREGGRALNIKTAEDDSWRDLLDDLNRDMLESIEAPVAPISRRGLSPATKDWILQSLQSLKTWSNVLCLGGVCPEVTDSIVQFCGPSCFFCGFPYFEQCPHCLARIERLSGCGTTLCLNCKRLYVSRQQVALPVGCAILGCNFDMLSLEGVLDTCTHCCPERDHGHNCFDTSVCWCVSPWRSCKIQCLPCCSHHDPYTCYKAYQVD